MWNYEPTVTDRREVMWTLCWLFPIGRKFL